MISILSILSLASLVTVIYLFQKLNKVEKAKEVLALGFIEELNKLRLDAKELHAIIENKGEKYNALKDSIPKLIKNSRQDAVETSRVVLRGKISEEFIPFLPEFPYLVADGKFFGSPFDLLFFEGLSEGYIKKIIFMDIKTGGAKLTNTQKQIKQAIEEGRISWETYVRK